VGVRRCPDRKETRQLAGYQVVTDLAKNVFGGLADEVSIDSAVDTSSRVSMGIPA